jgi:hypothetical protein
MAQSCKICHHPEREAIEAAINAGETQVSIALRFGVNRANVSRHKTGHMAPLQRVQARRNGQKPAASVDRLEQMYDDARVLLDDALATNRPQLSLAAMKELRQVVELLGKFTGELNDRPQVQVNLLASPDWHQVREVVFQVLQRYPGAAEELSSRLLELESR